MSVNFHEYLRDQYIQELVQGVQTVLLVAAVAVAGLAGFFLLAACFFVLQCMLVYVLHGRTGKAPPESWASSLKDIVALGAAPTLLAAFIDFLYLDSIFATVQGHSKRDLTLLLLLHAAKPYLIILACEGLMLAIVATGYCIWQSCKTMLRLIRQYNVLPGRVNRVSIKRE
jgi:hypothetical protein